MASAWARDRFDASVVARLATADAGGAPHVVPIVYARAGDTVYFAIDHKPKSGAPLRRLDNIVANPRVSVLVDHYADDWTTLWWARADGSARIVDDPASADAVLDLLSRRYPQYVTQRPPGPVVAIAVERWSGWRAAPPPAE
jgi:PPOX class probable F420-dependent enzyme